MPPDTRSQDLKRIEDKIGESLAIGTKDHDQKYDKVVKLLEVYMDNWKNLRLAMKSDLRKLILDLRNYKRD